MNKTYRGSMPGTTGHKSTNTNPNPNNTGPSTRVRQESGGGSGTLGPISNKNPFPHGMS